MAQTQTETDKKKKKSKKSSAAASGRKNSMGGFLVDKLDGDVMRSYIEENALDIDVEEVTDEQIGVALAMHFKQKIEDAEEAAKKKGQKSDIAVSCDECKGVATDAEETCPFCGDGGGLEEDEETEDEQTNTEELAAQALAEDEGDADDDEEDEEDEETEDKPEVEDEPPPAKKVAAKAKEKNMGTTAESTNGAGKKHAAAKGTSTALVSAKDLDKAVAEVIKLKSEGAENFWLLGKKLLEINVDQLWKLRLKDGKNAYKGFDTFVQSELNMSPQHAYRAIDLAKEYDDVKEVRELGHSKAALILQAAPQDRKKLKAKAKAGATKKALEADVKESRAKHGSPKKGKKAEAGAKGGANKAKAGAARAEKVSVANIEGSKTIKLFKRPDTIRGLDFATLARAKRIADVPFGKHELTNGVVQYFSVLEKDGELVLKIETKRETAE